MLQQFPNTSLFPQFTCISILPLCLNWNTCKLKYFAALAGGLPRGSTPAAAHRLPAFPPRWRATRSQGAAALTAARRRPSEARTPLVAYYCEHVGRCWRMVPARRCSWTMVLPPDKRTNSQKQRILSSTESSVGGKCRRSRQWIVACRI